MEWSNTVINTLEEFLKVAGFEIYDEEGEEIYLKVKSTNKIIKVRRDLFTKYITPNSSMDKEKPNKPDLDYNINVKSASMGLKEINPPKKICFKEKTEGSREIKSQNSELSNVEKPSEVQGANINSSFQKELDGDKEGKGNAFSHIFDGLENMSNTSTLFDGIDDDKPPPILPGRNLVNLEDNKHSSLSQAEDQSQLNKSNSKITSLNIFNMVKLSETPKNIITLNKDIK